MSKKKPSARGAKKALQPAGPVTSAGNASEVPSAGATQTAGTTGSVPKRDKGAMLTRGEWLAYTIRLYCNRKMGFRDSDERGARIALRMFCEGCLSTPQKERERG